MQVEIVPTLTKDQRRTLYGWGRDIFGAGVERRLADYPCRAFECFLVGSVDGAPVAAMGLVKALIDVDFSPLWVLGFGALVVVPTQQGHGYGAALIRQALNQAGVGGLLAFCEEHRLAYYVRRGFRRVDSQVFIQNAQRRSVATPQRTVWSLDRLPDAQAINVRGPRW